MHVTTSLLAGPSIVDLSPLQLSLYTDDGTTRLDGSWQAGHTTFAYQQAVTLVKAVARVAGQSEVFAMGDAPCEAWQREEDFTETDVHVHMTHHPVS